MALTFIYGNSGCGKSEYMYRKIADMAEHAPYQHYFVVVPEQFTMSAQRSLVDHSSSGVILNIDVVSFERLAYRVFDELGVHRTVMEETGKSLVLRRIAEREEQDLTYLRRSLTKMGYIGELKSVLSELMQYGISPDDLEDFLGLLDPDSALCRKLSDILKIYRSFEDYLEGGYVTAERVLDLLCAVAGESALLKGAVFFFDGYTGFTPVQMNLIRRLMHFASDLYVTVTLDVREPLYAPARIEDLFYMSHRMVNSLANAAVEASFPLADPVRIDAHDKSRFHACPVLSHLEQNLFRAAGTCYEDPCGEHLQITSLLTTREELRYAAFRIRTAVRKKGLRYRDCAIVCSDVEEYEKYADEIFSLYDIPVFVDRKQSLFYHPLTELVRAVLEIAGSDYSAESVFRYLRTGLCRFSPEEVDLLENYCLEKGIRGARRWSEPFVSLPERHGRLRFDEERAARDLSAINALRQRFAEQTKEAEAVFCRNDSSVRDRTEALYGLLCSLGVEEQLRAETERFALSGDEAASSVNRQVYKIVIDLLDKMVDLLGDEILPADDYCEILDAGFAAARVGTIPPGNDCVIMGDIERTRLENVKVLFLLGVNDGAIPKRDRRQSILSQHDREVLSEHDLELAPGEREEVFLQRFYLYLALTRPSDALYLSFSRMDKEGKAVRPSYLVAVLEKMFADLRVNEISNRDFLPMATAKSSVESWLTGLAASDGQVISPQWKALHRWYTEHTPWDERILCLFNAHFPFYRKERLDPALARALYGEVLFNSFTRLERFGSCAFAHFLEYGLSLAERGSFAFSGPDMGTLFHETLQKYGTGVEEHGGWRGAGEEEQDAVLREAIGDAVRELYDPDLFATAAGAYVLERVYRILKRSIWAITEQIRRGDFLPAGYEVTITERSMTLTEDNAAPDVQGEREENAMPQSARIVGRIDRMDVCEEDARVSVRVFDYKSGKTDLQLQNVYYGRQLQLPVYLNTAMEYLRVRYPGREIVPAGIFYFHLDDPMLADAGADVEEIQNALLKRMKPSGLVNADPAVLIRMDRGLAEGGTSEVVPVSLNRDGSVSKKSKNAVSPEAFDELMQYVRVIMDDAACRMTEGIIEVNPYRMKDRTGCDHCRYRGVCGFDLRIPGVAFREERLLPDEDALALMRERVRGDAAEESADGQAEE